MVLMIVVMIVVIMLRDRTHPANLPLFRLRRELVLELFTGHTGAMATPEGPSLADDEEQLATYGRALVDQIAIVGFDWLVRLVDLRVPGLAAASESQAVLRDGAAEVVAELRTLLAADLASQQTGPLDLLRRAVRHPTQVLAQAGAEPVARDEFAIRNFPGDVYNLSPGSFAEVDPSLHEPGLLWGAAKAHVHLRRRREAEQAVQTQATQSPPLAADRVVALSRDLMDQSKIKAAYGGVTMVRSPAKLVQEAAGASLVLVDLAMLNDPAALLAIEARVVAFGSHVDDAALRSAEDSGAEALPRSVFFRRLESGDL